ncbi:MAG: sigma-54-dependent Fis family transcriptional regulator, partial [Deltaproteobacteria bacterium]|nr:sigma-54-dependent Fis family transcriptional regulator [Deltaproteobacteria bacterium]
MRILEDAGYAVDAVEDGVQAISRLGADFQLVITDLRMPRATGLEVLAAARESYPELPVVVLTAFGSIPGAVDAMRLGAFDYLSKPLPDPDALRSVVRRALAGTAPAANAQHISTDERSRAVFTAAERVAPRDTTVLLLGESGVGKEVVAQHIHVHSQRRERAFVAVNCAALPETLLESELFGHERGAFTGAERRHLGRFEQADQGTLFLDEIAETSPAVQAKLLRVLQEQRFERVGAEKSIQVDVRIIAATNQDLEKARAKGTFREDLYYRLAVFPIVIPPLRERRADILPLARHFLALLQREHRTAPSLTSEAERALERHGWPGNVRELQNVMERAVVLAGSAAIGLDSLGLSAAVSAEGAGSEGG